MLAFYVHIVPRVPETALSRSAVRRHDSPVVTFLLASVLTALRPATMLSAVVGFAAGSVTHMLRIHRLRLPASLCRFFSAVGLLLGISPTAGSHPRFATRGLPHPPSVRPTAAPPPSAAASVAAVVPRTTPTSASHEPRPTGAEGGPGRGQDSSETRTSPGTSSAPLPPIVADPVAVAALHNLGIPEVTAREMLVQCGNNVDEAATRLLDAAQ